MDFEFDCFLSHNSGDKPVVRELVRLLKRQGVRVWLDEEQLVPGQSSQPLLERGIDASATGAVLVGAKGLGHWQDEETQTLVRRALRKGRPVIPVLLPGALAEPDLPGFLGNRTYVDLREGLEGPGLESLLWGIRHARDGRAATAKGVEPVSDPAPAGAPLLRIFVASPGDVADERRRALEQIAALPRIPELRGRVRLEPVAWDAPGRETPMPATLNPQQALAEGLIRPADCHLCVVIVGWRMGTPIDPAWQTRPDGRPYRSGTEWEFLDALASFEARGAPDILVYRRADAPAPRLDDPEHEEIVEQWRAVQAFFEEYFQNPDGSARRGWTAYETPTGLAERIAGDLGRMILDRLSQSAPTAPMPPLDLGPAAGEVVWTHPPYCGLRALRFTEARIFQGRGRQTDDLLARLADPGCRFLGVIGPSGSGKSSLVWAGLLPRLADNAVIGSKDWHWVRCTPAELRAGDPFLGLATALAHASALSHCGWEPRGLAVQLRAREGLAKATAKALDQAPAWAELLLFVDQLEELFRQVPETERRVFIDRLADAAALPRVRIVATLRVDFMPALSDYPRLAGLFNQGQYQLTPPGQPERLHMVAEPARLAGLELEQGLAEAVVAETGDQPGALPLMAYALERLYERDQGRPVLTWDSYRAFDGVRGAIASQARQVFDVFAEQHGIQAADAALAALFRELVQVDDPDAPATRRRARWSDLCADIEIGGESGLAAALADALIEARLLVSDRETGPVAALGPARVVDIAHEALLTSWESLADWIGARRDALRLRDLLRRSVAEWCADGYRHKYLLRADRAGDVLDALERLGQRPTAEERAFLEPAERAGWLLGRDCAAWVRSGRGADGLWGRERFEGFADLTPGEIDAAGASERPVGAGPRAEADEAADGVPGPEGRRAFLARSFEVCLGSHPDEPSVRAAVGDALDALGDPRFDPEHWSLPADPSCGFREIPAGRFLMGTDPERDPNGWDDERPQHPQDLPVFYLARWPVTVAQFQAFVAESGHRPADPESLRGRPNHPVVNITWYEAWAYCGWLQQRLDGLAAERSKNLASDAEPAARRFWQGVAAGSLKAGLPSEREWERAARGTDGRIYPWGDEIEPARANYAGTGLRRTCGVGCFPGGASPEGCEDLSGNVWEWTRSLWGPDLFKVEFRYPYKRDKREDLDAPNDVARVLRGGFSYSPNLCRGAVRYCDFPGGRVGSLGVRVVWSPFL